ncbi:hypothetical protein EJ08DRAFT_703533 [Tothia fuscella]|uniref:DUF7730 domain-containing protein n=1 Tax=Tothia fuscella TaxID=1048955 RepID=A0A9P4TSM6_9PEZI|nr:hypothetical protein EJ08DRAFT_703533 [Tothia fuscella]
MRTSLWDRIHAKTGRPAKSHLFAILLTCRSIYDEAVATMYSTIVFDFIGVPSMKLFMNSVPAAHLQKIHSLHYFGTTHLRPFKIQSWPYPCLGSFDEGQAQEWKTLWASVGSTIPKLHDVHITIFWNGPALQCFEDWYSEPLEKIKVTSSFTADAQWHLPLWMKHPNNLFCQDNKRRGHWRDDSEWPFVLTRRSPLSNGFQAIAGS